ncbi:MAG TPA: hypothetical protein VHF22_00970 [Planctomycetota bacterium]|nr:hypothetical protein [Planctomycetota bacterium]
MRPILLTAVCLAALAGSPARADEPTEALPPLKPPVEATSAVFAALAAPAKTPREALQKLELAARTGDPERAVPLFAEPFGTALGRTFAAGHLVMEATRRVEAAVTARLGPDAARQLALEKRLRSGPHVPAEGIEVVSLQETPTGASAVVRARSKGPRAREETIELVKQNGEWKLLPPKREGKSFCDQDMRQMELLSKGLENAAAALVKLASDVESGAVTTVADCRRQLEAADAEVMKAMIGFDLPDEDER